MAVLVPAQRPGAAWSSELHSTASLLSFPWEGSCDKFRLQRQPWGQSLCQSYLDGSIRDPRYPGTCPALAESPPGARARNPALSWNSRLTSPRARSRAVRHRLGFHIVRRSLSMETSTLPESNAR